jgi:hypothetical protein
MLGAMTGRWLRAAVAIVALGLVSCAHPSAAPPPPPPPLAAPPLAAPPLAAPPAPPCVAPQLKKLAATIPACAGVPAGLLDAARIKEVPLGSRVSVRGFLVPGAMGCTMKACFWVDPNTGERQPEPCCNGCRGFVQVAGLDEATATSQGSGATPILLRPAGSARPLETGAMDCALTALAASPREEIIASGRLEPGPMAPALGLSARDARSIGDATLCATGRWTPPPATADGGLPGCQ